jgi:cell wall-associated NlpC family hydrolase
MFKTRRFLLISIFTAVILALSGCAITSLQYQQRSESNHEALAVAENMRGVPYRYGGADPRGFDCSGLVYYAYRKAGIHSPRSTSDQYRFSTRVPLTELRPGDLVFFAISRNKPSHVGIYAGQGKFIHAPSSGKAVSYAFLDDYYWKEKLIGTGRL